MPGTGNYKVYISFSASLPTTRSDTHQKISNSVTVTKSYVWGWRECSAYVILGSEHLNTLKFQRVVGVVVDTMACHELGHVRIHKTSLESKLIFGVIIANILKD